MLVLWGLAGCSVPPPEPAVPRAFVYPDVQAAWERGGRPTVEELMRDWLDRAKRRDLRLASGGKLLCGSCHGNLKTYPLLPNAQPDLAALREALSISVGE